MTNDTTQDNPIKALLIEDNPGDARLIQYMVAEIASQAISLQIVDSLSSGCKCLLKGGIDVVLLDLSLPDSQGVNTLTQVQATAPHVPIVVLTGLDDDTIGLEAVSKGAQDYLVKGQIDHKLLVRAVRYAIGRKKAENALRESEEKFRAIIEQAADGIMIVDADLRIVEWGAAQTEIFGYTREEMLGKYLWEFQYATAPDEQKSPALLERVKAGAWQKTHSDSATADILYEFEVQCKDGSRKNVQFSSFAAQASHSMLFGAIIRDITAQKQAEEALRKERDKTQQYLDIAGVMFLSVDANQVIRMINKRGCEILEYDTPEEIIGKNWFDTCLPERSRAEAGVAFAQLIAGQTRPAEYMENPVLARSGTERIIAWHNTIIKDESGNITGILSSGEDITERKRAEEVRRESEERYHSLFENMLNGFAYCRMLFDQGRPQDFIYLDVNKAFESLTGLKDVVGKKVSEVIPGIQETDPGLIEAYGRVARTGQPVVLETYVEALQMWFSISVYSPQQEYFVAVFDGITTRKHAENALLYERSLLQALMNTAPDLIYFKDTASRFTRINQAEARLLGLESPEQAIGKTDFDFQWENLAQDAFAEEQRIIETGQEIVDRAEFNPTRDGTPRWLANTKVPIKNEQGQVTGIVGISRDITRRMQVEEALKQYARQLIVINDISQRVAGVMELEQLLDTVAIMAHESFGYDHVGIFIVDRLREGELVMKAKAGLYAPRFPAGHRLNRGQGMIGWAALYSRKLLANDVSTESNFYDPFGDGSTKAELSVPILSEGKVVGVIDIQSQHKDAFNDSDVMVMDTLADVLAVAIRNVRLYQELETYNQILEQAVQEATVEVRRTQERVGAILDNNPDAILLLKNSGAIETANPAFQELFGCHIDDLYGKLLTNLAGPKHVDMLQTALLQVIDTLERKRLEIVLQRLDGKMFDADMALSPIREGGAMEGIVCSIRDITALKEVDRMKDTFISNVSHELRTPITGIKLSHRLIAMDPGKQPVYLERMGREIERLHEIIENLLRLSRLDQGRVVLDIKPLDLNTLAAQYVGDRAPLANARQLKLLLNQKPDLPLALADEGLLGQVLSILLTNAVNYTPSGGEIVVSTRLSETDGKRWVGLRVSDTGPGIPTEDLPHLGERFYRGKTGRDSGAPGTGLGLAIAREIIDRHHGRMEISNEGVEDTGATFTFWLPTEDSNVQEGHTKKKHSK